MVDGPEVLCSTKPWTVEEGALRASFFLFVPITDAGGLWVEAGQTLAWRQACWQWALG